MLVFGRPVRQAAALATGEERVVPTVPGRWRCFCENVAEALAGKVAPAVKLTELRRDMAVFDAAVRSAQSGETVHPTIPALTSAAG